MAGEGDGLSACALQDGAPAIVARATQAVHARARRIDLPSFYGCAVDSARFGVFMLWRGALRRTPRTPATRSEVNSSRFAAVAGPTPGRGRPGPRPGTRSRGRRRGQRTAAPC